MKVVSLPTFATVVTVAIAAVAATGTAHARTSFDGGWTVQIMTQRGEQRADGSGRLSASAGGGAWHGVGSRGVCAGRWSASRR
jgi:hypothetical protein